ncbi:MAG: extracellular solute-binding protein [Treponema sp.]|jgi:raffinose/stachyose/melibiose transport system substrate-binding protein|nr:extracellular solute-binding protein [Treponema sp.]
MKTVTRFLFLALIVLTAAGAAFAGPSSQGGGKTRIEFVSLKREAVDIMNKLIADFEAANPTIDVEQTIVPDPERVLTTRMASNDVPDLFSQWPTVNFQQRVDAGHIADISDLAAIRNIKDDALKVTRYKGKDWLIPISYNTMGVWYNKDIFARYNIAVPTTWAEFISACKTLKANNITPALICGKELEPTRQDMCVYLLTVPDYDTLQADWAARRVDLSKPYGNQLRDMARRIVEYQSYAQTDVIGSGRDQLRADFASGRAAMYIEGSWCIPTFEAANPNLNFSLMPLPAVNAADTRVTAFPGDFAITMSSSAKYPAESRKFLEFITTPAAATYYAEKDGSISCIKGVTYVAPQLADQQKVIDGGRSRSPADVIWTTKQQDDIGAALQNLYMTGDVEKFVTTLRDVWNNG